MLWSFLVLVRGGAYKVWNSSVYLQCSCEPVGRDTEAGLKLTRCMQTYSTATEATVMARTAQVAMAVDAIATRDITRGPTSLHERSMRRILAFTTATVLAEFQKLSTRRIYLASSPRHQL
jgi:hypothetical protein